MSDLTFKVQKFTCTMRCGDADLRRRKPRFLQMELLNHRLAAAKVAKSADTPAQYLLSPAVTQLAESTNYAEANMFSRCNADPEACSHSRFQIGSAHV